MPIFDFDGKRPPRGATPTPAPWIAPSAAIIGEVSLGAGASVWFGAVIRADNTTITIGAGSNVQDGAILHSDPGFPLTVGEDVTIGHRAMLHGCTIGDRVLIGVGAIVLNRACIDSDSIVGAGALVPEGKTFPPGSLIVGMPAQVKRALTPAEIEGLRANAEDYRSKAARYATTLSVVDESDC